MFQFAKIMIYKQIIALWTKKSQSKPVGARQSRNVRRPLGPEGPKHVARRHGLRVQALQLMRPVPPRLLLPDVGTKPERKIALMRCVHATTED